MKTNVQTNNQAEILACTLAVRTVFRIVERYPSSHSFIIRGDSAHVIDTLLSGRLASFVPNSRFPNSSFWKDLKTEVDKAKILGVSLSFSWVPRRFNKESDELCNAILDGREPNPLVSSVAGISLSLEESLDSILSHLSSRRSPVVRCLPIDLAKNWQALVQNVCGCLQTPHSIRRKIFLIFPHLLSLHQSVIKNRHDFKTLRAHITMMGDPMYLADSISSLVTKLSSPPTPFSSGRTNESIKLKTLASRGLFDKMFTDDSISVLTEVSKEQEQKTRDMFPTSPLPFPILDILSESEEGCKFDIQEIVKQIPRLKRGKAPGLSGWTRELLYPLICDSPILPFLKFLQTSLQEIANGFLSLSEQNFLRSGVLTLLTYKGSEKIRPIVVKDVLCKLVWRILLSRISDPSLSSFGSVFSRKGGSALGVCVVQRTLDLGGCVVSLDAKNAFNCVSRHAAFKYLFDNKEIYKDVIPFINFNYCNPSTAIHFSANGNCSFSVDITSGTSQGCVSGPIFLEWAKCPILSHLRTKNIFLLTISDDTYIINPKSPSEVDYVVECFQGVNLDLTGPKAKILSFYSSPPCFPIPSIPNCSVFSNPTSLLGCVVYPFKDRFNLQQNGLDESIACLSKMFGKIKSRIKFILECQTSLQIKFLMLRAIQWYQVYHVSCLPSSKFSCDIIDSIEKLYTECAVSLLSLSANKPNLHVHLFSPIEDGGLGLLPYSLLRKDLHNSLLSLAMPVCESLGIPTLSVSCENSSMKQIWKHAMATRRKIQENNIEGSKSVFENKSWLQAWPTSHITTMDDDCFLFGVHYRLGFIAPYSHRCLLHSSVDFSKLSGENVFEHVESCVSCGGIFFHIRHERVNNVLHKTFRHHSLVSEINPSGFPIPDNDKGGPDFLLFVGSKTYAGDVSITKQKTQVAYNRKIRTYKEFSTSTTFITFPFILSSKGFVDIFTMKILNEIAMKTSSSSLVRDCVVNTQFELVKGQFTAMKISLARSNLSISSPPPVMYSSLNEEFSKPTQKEDQANSMGKDKTTNETSKPQDQTNFLDSPQTVEPPCSHRLH